MRATRQPRYRRAALLGAALATLPLGAASVRAQAAAPAVEAPAPAAPAARRALGLSDYGRWARVTSTALSDDGRWLAYAVAPNDGDTTLHLRRLDDTLVHRIPAGSGARFADGGRHVVFLVQPLAAEAERLRKARRPVPRTAVVLDLATGRRDSVPHAQGVELAPGGRWLAVRRVRTDTASGAAGADVVLRDLHGGGVRHLGAVAHLAFDSAGTRLAYAVDAAGRAGNGAYLLELASGRTTPLATGAETFDGLAWNADGTALAVLHGAAPAGSAHRANALAVFTRLGDAAPARAALAAGAVPDGMVVSENAVPRWSADGARLFVGLRAQEPAPPEGDAPRANVDVWHWRDADVQSVQMVRAAQERRFTHAAAFEVATGRLVRLTDDAMRTVTHTRPGTIAVGRDDAPYRGGVQWGAGRADYHAVDTRTGARTPIARGVTRAMGTSPDGRWFLYLKDSAVVAHDLRANRAVDLTAATGVDFVDVDDDRPYERPTYGVAGWSRDGRSVLLNHRHDVWQVPLAGGRAVNLTRGVGDSLQVRFRLVRLDPRDAAEGVDLAAPLVFASYGRWDKRSGWWRREPGGALRPIVHDDRQYGALAKAERADRVVFTRQTFEEFPDVWTAPRLDALPRAERVTDANPHRAEFAWGRRVLVDFANARGQRLQGTLALPAGYEPGKRYPMIVYFYEQVSQRHHEFSLPVWDDRPHFSAYASDGYLVFMPDITYETGKPGSSALDAVTSGVRKVIELGYADSTRMAIQGHSWGGYQGAYIITQTPMFRAAVIGAPPANLVSMYDQLYKNTGTVNQGIFEVGQVRMGADRNPWNARDLYVSQSPVHQIQGVTTPFLILHGTEDGAVDWLQGVELFNAARRFGKEVILLSYPGENHHLARRENARDFQTRMKQWFDHYLKDAPAPAWMTEGVPHLRKATATP